MIITNFQNLAKNDLRKKALEIAEAGYEAIKIEKAVLKRIKLEGNKLKIGYLKYRDDVDSQILENTGISQDSIEINLNNFKRIFVVGIGKGSALACATLEKILDKRLTSGIALDVQYQDIQYPKIDENNIRTLDVQKLKIFRGSHPLPSEQNIEATQKIIELAGNLQKGDLLLNFICGGGSALACASEEELKNSSIIFKQLTKAGAIINELNVVRKHLSKIKGGGLAKMACGASKVISLIVSDVCGNDLATVSSGPTVFDKTTKKDAENILKKYGLNAKDFHLYETPKKKECFNNIENILFICNQDAVMAMAEKAQKLGFEAKIYSLALQGEATDALAPIIKAVKLGQAVLAAGETTVALEGRPNGKGGRNTEAVLSALISLKIKNQAQFAVGRAELLKLKIKNFVILSFTSDGRDNTEAAGAIGDLLTLQTAEKLNINPKEFLKQNQSFDFFNKTGDLIYAKKKCFNVADLMIVLKEK